jgi:hypothetical protein
MFKQLGKKGMNLMLILVEVLLLVILLPVIAVQIAGAQNISATTRIILALFEIFIAIGALYGVGKQAGVIKG